MGTVPGSRVPLGVLEPQVRGEYCPENEKGREPISVLPATQLSLKAGSLPDLYLERSTLFLPVLVNMFYLLKRELCPSASLCWLEAESHKGRVCKSFFWTSPGSGMNSVILNERMTLRS